MPKTNQGEKIPSATGSDAVDGPQPEAPKKPAEQITISLDALTDLGKQITEIDTKIASASGSDAAAKKALVEQLATENAERITQGTDQIVSALADVPLDVLVGLVTRLEERIKAEFGEKISTFLDEKYASTAGTSKEEASKLREIRKNRVVKFKALREVLESFGQDTASVPDPKRSGGGRPVGSGGSSGGGTKSGMNKEGYRYVMDGKDRPPSQNSFSSLAYYATTNCPTSDGSKRWTSNRLREFIKDQGVTFGEDDVWEVELPNGKKIGARRFTEEDKAEFGIEDAQPASPVSETPVTV